jgi:hypothetical protein
LRDLFSLRVDMVFYDLTSTYFEGQGPPEKGAHGHSRDGKPRNPQVLVGLVMVDGWPIAHHVFQGNWRDAKTVPEVLSDLEQRFGLKRVVFVGDRGMVTSHNLALVREHGHGYIVGRNRRRSGEVFDYIQSATGPWTECPVGITAREKQTPPKTLVQEVASKEPGVRVFVVHSEERQAFECRHGRCSRPWSLYESCEDIVDQSFDLVGGQDRRNGHAGGCRPQRHAIAFNLGVGAFQPSWHRRPRNPAAHDLHHRLFAERDVPEAGANRVVAAAAALSHATVTIEARGPGPGVLAGNEARIVLCQDRNIQSNTGGKRQRVDTQTAAHATHLSTCAMERS